MLKSEDYILGWSGKFFELRTVSGFDKHLLNLHAKLYNFFLRTGNAKLPIETGTCRWFII